MEPDRVLKPGKIGRFGAIRWEQFRLPRQLKGQGNPLLVNFCNTAPFSYANQIVTIHDLATFDHPEWFRPSFAKYYAWLLPRIAKGALKVVTVSEWSKQRIMEQFHLNEAKIHVIPPAVDPALLEAEEEGVDGLENGFILMVGSLDPRKQFDKAALILQKEAERQGLTLVIAGAAQSHFISMHLPIGPSIRFIPSPSDGQLAWLYRHCALVLHPSLYEGFSLVPHEALAFGARVLVSDIPVHREALKDSVSYVDPKQLTALPDAVMQCLKAPSPTSNATTTFGYASSGKRWRTLIEDVQ